MIYALDEFRHESRFTPGSEYTMSDSWARRPALRRKIRKRLQEIVPDKDAFALKVVESNQLFYKPDNSKLKYIPESLSSAATKNHYTLRKSILLDSLLSKKEDDQFGIMIEGSSLQYILNSPHMRMQFLDILNNCEAVIVCRASPS
jgi:hypothetical protein